MLIGLTGGISSGKSTVSNLFAKNGFPIIDVDDIAKKIVEPGELAYHKVIEYFGEEILLPNKQLDRKKLGEIIFSNSQKRDKLNKITHPIIYSKLLEQAEQLQAKHSLVIVDIPLLFESKREKIFDLIIVVYVDKKTQIKRLMKRENITEEEALKKINSQISLEEKKQYADYVILNNKDINYTEQQVRDMIDKINGVNYN